MTKEFKMNTFTDPTKANDIELGYCKSIGLVDQDEIIYYYKIREQMSTLSQYQLNRMKDRAQVWVHNNKEE